MIRLWIDPIVTWDMEGLGNAEVERMLDWIAYIRTWIGYQAQKILLEDDWSIRWQLDKIPLWFREGNLP